MLDALLYPKTVAVIGASRSPGKVGHEIVANLKSAGFKGEIVPINPSGGEVLGIPCFADLKSYGKTIDHAVIAVPVKLVLGAIQGAIEAGVKAVTIITAGFKEVGKEGAALEREIAGICKAAGVRILGPNCLGLINTENGLNASFAKQMPTAGRISVVSQSGALCTAILDWSVAQKVGLAKLLSIGNKADLDETDLLPVLAADDQTKVVAFYLESISRGEEFMKAAEEAGEKKPIVVLKVGTSKAGGKAASSHTGSLAGADIAYTAAFNRSGVIRAHDFEALFDIAIAFSTQPIPKGNRIAVITNAGGPGIIAADASEHSGLQIGSLTPSIAESLKAYLPAAASVGNPIDVLGDAPAERYAEAVKAAVADESVDMLLVILTPQAMTDPVATARAIAAVERNGKPMVTSFMGGHDVMPAREELMSLGIPDYPAPDRAVNALQAMSEYSAWLKRPKREVVKFDVDRAAVEKVIERHVGLGRYEIGEVGAKEILKAYGFNVLPGRLATSPEDAAKAASECGFPVVMKIVSPQILHKSDFGGVKLNLNSPEEVSAAYTAMMEAVAKRAPDALLEGVYVEKMGERGREVILGVSRDPQFGPMIMFGLGGIFVEVMKDVKFDLAPLTADDAMNMLKGTRSYALLKGVRGQAGVDIPGLVDGLQRISQLVTDFPQIVELDINPLLAGPEGTKPVVADGRMTIAK
jgi:acetyltransferase